MSLLPRTRPKPEAVLDGLTTAVVVLDERLHVVALNTATEGLLGISRSMVLGKALCESIPHFVPLKARLTDANARALSFIERELSLKRGSEPAVTVDCTVTPFGLARQAGLLVEMQALDRHLRISREEWQIAHQEASRELVRGLAHEIKNPLGGIRGAAQLLEVELPSPDHREYTQVIIREADRLQNLVNRLLGPNQLPQNSWLNIHEVVEHVRQLVGAELPPGIELLRDYDPSIPDLYGEREQLVQVLLNIVRNGMQALQAADQGGVITLRTRTQRQVTIGATRHRLAIRIDVEDDGPGVPAEMIDRIFYPMVTTRPEGSGLGLPIAHYLVRRHEGMIECRSQPGETIFSIYLPLDTAS
ncbi:MAG: nitrogen regulation protein NR(II) [Polycyclovorans sp.]|jgi:two-component system nitrogen regulation sensor histidine kinase GlnL|nr:nitrogen regulation protein NR(II) [Polycyclovorans sp.]MBU0791497.1 nitrogen regulation protein NR(II) [Gammaproteobacteria bacterium]MDP1541892.1 nitrogen regulation protein NR(II) [Polycyclovorans sp.]MEC8847948.1 nitrogen regulation protein NR(II) [Pseudomonadota bacterium]|tara:strand:- start:1512 stop:2591 length:1080 start_codon:yes stop_codon:yes gene_type:complete